MSLMRVRFIGETAMRPSIVAICLTVTVIGTSAHGPERIAYDYSAMYESLNPSIVKVHSDFGAGSGFVVTGSGMIATNHHVIRNTRYAAVEFADGRKFAADIVLLDPRHDLAVLKVNKSVLGAVQPLRLLPPEKDSTVKAGIPVVAFGSPLSQTFLMTQGIVSKAEPGVLLGDFLIQPGNSGGPLVNLAGEVIGINTFAERGISGAVRINVLRDALERPMIAAYSAPEPDASKLPVPDKERYPTEILKRKILNEPLDASAYSIDAGRFMITAITPVLVGKMQAQQDLQQAANRYARRAKKIKDEHFDPADEPFYEWVRNAAGYLDAVVTLEVKPQYGQTSGSAWASALSAFSAGMSHQPMMPTRQTMEFKSEFQEVKLYRDNELVRPITPGRQITGQSVDTYYLQFVDEAYSGWYVYHPSVFSKGSNYRIEVYDAREPGRIHKTISLNESSKLVQQIRRDFEEVR